MNETLRAELLRMAEEDGRVRDELAADGAPSQGYHPRMREVHERNAARLEQIIQESGWPGRNLVGEGGAQAAWLIAQHAIGLPAFLRRCLKLQEEASERGDIPKWQPAYLLDRIRMYEGKPQVYGTQFLPDENGIPSPHPIEDPETVDERRRRIGLEPMAERIRKIRDSSPPKEAQFSSHHSEWKRGYAAWLCEVGWRD